LLDTITYVKVSGGHFELEDTIKSTMTHKTLVFIYGHGLGMMPHKTLESYMGMG